MAAEDKQRYDKEIALFKKGSFQGRSQQQAKVNSNINHVKVALEITNELLEFIQTQCQQTGGAASQAGAEEEFPDEIEDPDAAPEELQNEKPAEVAESKGTEPQD